jgi:hypothetical protein
MIAINRLVSYKQSVSDLNCLAIVEKKIIRVWRYQKGNQNPYIEEEQTTQWPKEKVQNTF